MMVKCDHAQGCNYGSKCEHNGFHEKDGSCEGIEVPCDMHNGNGDIVYVTCIPAHDVLKRSAKIYDKAQQRITPVVEQE